VQTKFQNFKDFINQTGIDFLAFNQKMTPIRIKNIRKIFNLTQVKFAQVLGVSFHTYKNWEIGHRIPCSPAVALLYIAETQPEAFIKKQAAFDQYKLW